MISMPFLIEYRGNKKRALDRRMDRQTDWLTNGQTLI